MAAQAKRDYKDRVFKDLFGAEERKAYTLSLYNALAGTDYGNPGELELTTLDDVLYVSMKNDVSFLIGDEMVLWEHQSTKNSNMPLRGLEYFGRLYSKQVEPHRKEVYRSKRIKLPRPRFVVFYNGAEKAPVEEVQRLSEAYGGNGDVEVIAHIVNVNAGSGARVLEKCESLGGYAELVRRIRANSRTMGFSEAVDIAIRSCIADGILAEYLSTRRAEVKDMLMTEYDEEQFKEWYREEGLEQGRKETLLANISSLMESTGWDAEKAMEALGVPKAECEEYLERLKASGRK